MHSSRHTHAPCSVCCRAAGFSCYSLYNLALKFSPTVQQEYHARFGPVNPVELNDVFFGLHALLLSLLMAMQCLLYKRTPQQRVSLPTSLTLLAAAATALGFAGYLALTGEGGVPLTWLDLCYMCSFFKMGITLIKYIPQVGAALSKPGEGRGKTTQCGVRLLYSLYVTTI